MMLFFTFICVFSIFVKGSVDLETQKAEAQALRDAHEATLAQIERMQEDLAKAMAEAEELAAQVEEAEAKVEALENSCEDRDEDLAVIMLIDGYTCETALDDYPDNICSNDMFIPYCCKTCSMKPSCVPREMGGNTGKPAYVVQSSMTATCPANHAALNSAQCEDAIEALCLEKGPNWSAQGSGVNCYQSDGKVNFWHANRRDELGNPQLICLEMFASITLSFEYKKMSGKTCDSGWMEVKKADMCIEAADQLGLVRNTKKAHWKPALDSARCFWAASAGKKVVFKPVNKKSKMICHRFSSAQQMTVESILGDSGLRHFYNIPLYAFALLGLMGLIEKLLCHKTKNYEAISDP